MTKIYIIIIALILNLAVTWGTYHFQVYGTGKISAPAGWPFNFLVKSFLGPAWLDALMNPYFWLNFIIYLLIVFLAFKGLKKI